LHALGCDWLEFGADLRVGLSRAYNGAYGYEYIPFTGLYHVGAREYDPRTARWLQRDPIDVAGGHPNVYLYCGNDPLNAADPYGLWDWAKYFRDVGNVFVGYGQAIWGTLSSPFVIGQYYWENGVSWESTKQLVGGMWAGFCADWQAAWAWDARAFGRAFGGVLITVGTAAAPFARGGTAGTGVSTVGRGGARPVQVGQAGERAARIPQGSKAQIRINGRTRIPDRLTQSELIEVKNVRKLSYTEQLRDFYEYCNRNNLRFVLVVRRDTRLSRTLQEMERRGQIVVRRTLR